MSVTDAAILALHASCHRTTDIPCSRCYWGDCCPLEGIRAAVFGGATMSQSNYDEIVNAALRRALAEKGEPVKTETTTTTKDNQNENH